MSAMRRRTPFALTVVTLSLIAVLLALGKLDNAVRRDGDAAASSLRDATLETEGVLVYRPHSLQTSADNDLTISVLGTRADTEGLGPQQGSGDGSQGQNGKNDKVLVKVPTTNAEIEALARKGQDLLTWISQSARDATRDMRLKHMIAGDQTSQSSFTEYTNIEQSGWQLDTADMQQNPQYDLSPVGGYAPVEEALESLNLDTTVAATAATPHGANKVVIWTHKSDVIHGDRQYTVSILASSKLKEA